MYEIKAWATDDAGWAQRIDLIDDSTGQALDTDDASFALAITECGTAIFSATSADGGIEVPQTGTIQWRFSAADLGSLCPGTTYRFGCTMTNDAGTTQLLLGTLAFLDGSAR